ncbi:MAG TPA: hypothetical protein VF064_18745 [Pyrinomonadaceae bacterium]
MGEEFSTEGAPAALERSQFMPALSIELAVERYNAVTEFVSRVLRRDVDYGVIPGTEKRTLLKPGAEKLTTFFGLSTRFQLVERIEDWSGESFGGEPFFYYLYRCRLHRGPVLMAEADGSCNSREQKYRWREAQRVCPECNQAAIIKGREEYGGGWLCFRKKGGCGAKFGDGDAVIESQQTGRVFNAEIADQVNTMQKMAQKRSLVAAVLLAVNASEFFTQDVEDMAIPTTAVVKDAGAPAAGAVEDEIRAACRGLGKTEEQLAAWVRKKYGAEGIAQLTTEDKRDVLTFLQGMLTKREAA